MTSVFATSSDLDRNCRVPEERGEEVEQQQMAAHESDDISLDEIFRVGNQSRPKTRWPAIRARAARQQEHP